MSKKIVLKNSINKLFLRLSVIFFFGSLAIFNPAALRAQENQLEYHGFKVNFEQIKDAPQKDTVLKAVERQIEIVEQVKLSEDNLKFFKTIPLVMIPDASGTPGIYGNIKKTVFLKGRDLDGGKPILLHEYLHAYHDLKLPDGFQNAQIQKFYEEAKAVYPNFTGTYFLSNDREFFAVTASIYIFGNIPRPPFNQSTVKTAQPLYYQYLDSLFGQHKSN